MQQMELAFWPSKDREHLDHGGVVERAAALRVLANPPLGEEAGLRVATLVPGAIEVAGAVERIPRTGSPSFSNSPLRVDVAKK